MKNFLFFFIFIQFCNSFVLADNFNWTLAVKNKSGSGEFYLDNESVRTIGNYNYQWILANYLKDSDEIKSDISYTTIDCSKNRMQIVVWSEYSEFNGKGNIEGHTLTSPEDLKWSTAKPDTVMSSLIEDSCANKVSSTNSTNTDKKNIKKKPKNKKKKYKEF